MLYNLKLYFKKSIYNFESFDAESPILCVCVCGGGGGGGRVWGEDGEGVGGQTLYSTNLYSLFAL